MTMHIAYVEWTPEYSGTHEATFETNHSVKSCAAKSPGIDVEIECDVMLPDVIRHMVTGETEARARSLADQFALTYVPYGTDYRIHYVGVIA